MPHEGLRFDRPVAANGYAWWYIDAWSDDGRHGITAIAFIGSVFSPYYAWARRGNAVDPTNHCAINVALYGADARRWAMTERGSAQVEQRSDSLSIGPSSMRWNGSALDIDVNEICSPIPRPLRGSIRVTPTAMCESTFALDPHGRHRWSPYAPCARVEVRLNRPELHWSGLGYFDSNRGDEPLEETFEEWTWSRAPVGKRTVVLYDTTLRNAAPGSLALQFSANGEADFIDAPARVALDGSRWRLPRTTRADTESGARIKSTLEDAPFYSRSLLDTRLMGNNTLAMHESLSLNRFKMGWVQCLLPFRMPRIAF